MDAGIEKDFEGSVLHGGCQGGHDAWEHRERGGTAVLLAAAVVGDDNASDVG